MKINCVGGGRRVGREWDGRKMGLKWGGRPPPEEREKLNGRGGGRKDD